MAQQLGITGCSSKWAGFNSQHPHYSSQLSQGIQQPLLAFERIECKYTDIYAGETTGVYRLNNKIKFRDFIYFLHGMYMHHACSVLLEAERVLNPLELELLLESNQKFGASGLHTELHTTSELLEVHARTWTQFLSKRVPLSTPPFFVFVFSSLGLSNIPSYPRTSSVD